MNTTVPQRPDPRTFDWPPELVAEFEASRDNGCVGSTLVSETERVRVWHLRLAPGERIGFHTHVLDYFWTVFGEGRSRSHVDDGSIVEASYAAGATTHYRFGAGERKTHDLINIGESELLFTTVEFLGGANEPLVLPDSVRLALSRSSSPPCRA